MFQSYVIVESDLDCVSGLLSMTVGKVWSNQGGNLMLTVRGDMNDPFGSSAKFNVGRQHILVSFSCDLT